MRDGVKLARQWAHRDTAQVAIGDSRLFPESVAPEPHGTGWPFPDCTINGRPRLTSSFFTATSKFAEVFFTGTGGLSPTARIRVPGRKPSRECGTAGNHLVDLDHRAYASPFSRWRSRNTEPAISTAPREQGEFPRS